MFSYLSDSSNHTLQEKSFFLFYMMVLLCQKLVKILAKIRKQFLIKLDMGLIPPPTPLEQC